LSILYDLDKFVLEVSGLSIDLWIDLDKDFYVDFYNNFLLDFIGTFKVVFLHDLLLDFSIRLRLILLSYTLR